MVDSKLETLIEMYCIKRMSQMQCANAIGVSKPTAAKMLRRAGISIRTKSDALLGRIMTDEHRKKISSAKKGKPLSDEHKIKLTGKTAWNYGAGRVDFECKTCGKKISAKPYRNKRYCSAECRNSSKGEKHFNYKGSDTRGDQTKRNWRQYKDFKKEVHARDGMCLSCSKKHDFIAHHIRSWANHKELRFDPKNAITLCSDCHRDLHNYCGLRNIDMEKQIEWLNKKSIAI